MTHWTHAYRRPGPTPDRCIEDDGDCGCELPDLGESKPDGTLLCAACGHELVPVFSGRPSDSPEPPR